MRAKTVNRIRYHVTNRDSEDFETILSTPFLTRISEHRITGRNKRVSWRSLGLESDLQAG